MSKRIPPILATAIFSLGSLSLAQAQITFTIPSDAPDGGFGTVGILEITANGNMDNQNNARDSLQGVVGTRLSGVASRINFRDSGQGGNFGNDQIFLSDTDQIDPANDTVSNIAVLYRGTVLIPETGVYTFGVNSDDGFTLAFDGGASPFSNVFTPQAGATDELTTLQTYNSNVNGAIQFFGGRGERDSLGQISLSAGAHPFTLTYHEGGGGSSVELFAAKGEFTTFVPGTFALVGAPTTTTVRDLPSVGMWNYVEYNTSGKDDSIAKFEAAVDSDPNNDPVTRATGLFGTINFIDPENPNAGTHVADAVAFPGDTTGNSTDGDNDFGAGARVTLTVALSEAGAYTFMVHSDDSNRFRLLDAVTLLPIDTLFGNSGLGFQIDTDGDLTNDAVTSNNCCADSFGKWTLAEGSYVLEAIFAEGGGGSSFLVYGAKGDQSSFGPAFQLVGANINETVTTPGGLALVPEPSSALLLAVGSLLGISRRRRS